MLMQTNPNLITSELYFSTFVLILSCYKRKALIPTQETLVMRRCGFHPRTVATVRDRRKSCPVQTAKSTKMNFR
jgi:hypothetical protein